MASEAQLVLTAATAAVGSGAALLSTHDPRRGGGRIMRSHNLPAPVADALVRAADGALRTGVGGSPERGAIGRLGGTEAAGHVLQAVLPGGGEVWVLHLVRNEPAAPYGDAEVMALGGLVPLFAALLRAGCHSARAVSAAAAAWDCLDRLSLGVCILGAGGHLLGMNRAARTLLHRDTRLQVAGGRLVAAGATGERLSRALAEIAGAPPGAATDRGVRPLVLPPPAEDEAAPQPADGDAWQAVLHRLEDSGGGAPRCALFLFATAEPGPVEGMLRELYGLTRVEAEIAALVCRGQSPAEIAAHLRGSVHTVRSYLKPILQKVGVRRQMDLVRRVACGVGMLAAVPPGPSLDRRFPTPLHEGD